MSGQGIICNDYILDTLDKSILVYSDCFRIAADEFDEESIHNLRVSIRRLNTLQDLLIVLTGSEFVKRSRKQVKQQFNQLSSLRDVQVMMLYAKKLEKQFPEVRSFIKYLKHIEKINQQKVKLNLNENVIYDSEALFFFSRLDLKNYFHFNHIFFEELVALTHEKFSVVEDLEKYVDGNNSETIHDMRIAFKKFRYSYEFLLPVLVGPKYSSKELGVFQTTMGVIQDIEVFTNEFCSFIDSHSSSKKMLNVLIFLIEERRRLIDKFIENKDEYVKFSNMKLINNSQ